jgi:hypothetical protein
MFSNTSLKTKKLEIDSKTSQNPINTPLNIKKKRVEKKKEKEKKTKLKGKL